jgi:hypothetical protein
MVNTQKSLLTTRLKTLRRKILGPVMPFAVAALMIGAAMGIRSGAQSANPASNPSPTNQMSQYLEAQQEALVSGTAATNLSDVECSRLMNESLRTNLAAQLWFRSAWRQSDLLETTISFGAPSAKWRLTMRRPGPPFRTVSQRPLRPYRLGRPPRKNSELPDGRKPHVSKSAIPLHCLHCSQSVVGPLT